MRLFITCDAYWEAKVEKVIDRIDDTGYKAYFSAQEYGKSLDGITVVLMCQDPELCLKQRIRLSKKEKKLYLDIMLDLTTMLLVNQKNREKIIVDKLIQDIPPIIEKYKLPDFNVSKFKKDLNFWMLKIL